MSPSPAVPATGAGALRSTPRARATQSLDLGPGRWRLSLQYHSQTPLTVSAPGSTVELPPSLDGMYLTHKGQGAFWPAGELRVRDGGPVTVTVTVDAARPSGLQRDLGVERRVWLGTLAATRPGRRRGSRCATPAGGTWTTSRSGTVRAAEDGRAEASRNVWRCGRGRGDCRCGPGRHPAPFVFVGGTGRSGTHVIARLLSRHPHFALVPVEVRFHVEERGFPGLLAGRVSREDFVRRLRGFWWKGFQTGRMRGMFRFVPEERFEAAIAAFEAGFDDDPEARLPPALPRPALVPGRPRRRPAGLVEQSTDTVAEAATLVRLFDGGEVHPRGSRRARRLRLAGGPDARGDLPAHPAPGPGVVGGADPARGRRLSRDPARPPADREPRRAAAARPERPCGRCACSSASIPGPAMRRFFRLRMSAEHAHAERWREGLSERQIRELERLYERALDRLEADGVACVPLLRRTLERSRAGADGGPPPIGLRGGRRPRARGRADERGPRLRRRHGA